MTNERPRILALFGEGHDFPLDDAFLGYVGSQSHGTYVPKDDPNSIDDVDVMGVVRVPPRYFAGLDTFEHWTRQHEELDIVVYSLHKFARLLLKGNPNVLGLLWLRPEDNLDTPPAWWMTLRDHRSLFVSKAAYTSFAGYANGQLERMTSYSPEIDAEIDRLTAELDAAGWYVNEIMDRRPLPMPRGMDPKIANDKAQRLRSLRAKFKTAYMGEKRRNLVKRHGYDSKNAAHLVRLLRMCKEFLATGNLNVYRTHDVEELKAIKRGEWQLDDVKALSAQLFAECRVARDASSLPDQPDYAAASSLVTTLTMDYRG